MYYIEQLKSKDLPGLQAIAQELGVSNAKSLSKEDLIYRILDELGDPQGLGKPR